MTESDERWRPRPAAARVIRLVAFAIPFCASTLVVGVAVEIFRPAAPLTWSAGTVAWIGGLLAVGSVTAVVADRAARPLFPLASLMQMSLVFPDRAPSRTLIALRAGSVRTATAMTAPGAGPASAGDAAAHILALVSSLSRHDRITRGHCERVRAYADLMATQLDLSPHDADRLRWAALLHDIGKLRVPYAVLNKKGRLDADEWEAIKRHPADGAELVAPMAAFLGPWADAVAQHHERVDGTGYPSGLIGGDINLGARIIAVVDAFDVMTASRSYKRPVTSAAARLELQRCAGSQFDPDLVDAFLALPAPRSRWAAGVAAAALQIARIGNVLRVPAPVAGALSGLPSAAASTVGVGVTSLVLVAGFAAASGSVPAVAESTGPAPSAPATGDLGPAVAVPDPPASPPASDAPPPTDPPASTTLPTPPEPAVPADGTTEPGAAVPGPSDGSDAAKDKEAKDKAAKDKAAQDQAAKDQAAKDQAAKDQAAKDQAARDQADKDQAGGGPAAKDKAPT